MLSACTLLRNLEVTDPGERLIRFLGSPPQAKDEVRAYYRDVVAAKRELQIARLFAPSPPGP